MRASAIRQAPRWLWLVGALAAVITVAVVAGGWLATTRAGDEIGHAGRHADGSPGPVEPEVVTTRVVGPGRTVALAGSGGSVRLEVDAEVADSGAPLRAIPAGAPVTLTFTLDRPQPARTARSPVLEARSLNSRGAAGPAVPLAQPELVLFDRVSGVLSAPAPDGGHGPGHADPGLALAQSSLRGGAMRWARTVAPGATEAELSPDGRWLAATVGSSIRIFDILRRVDAGSIPVGGRPVALRFAPDGRVWAVDADGGAVVAVDVATRRVAGRVTVGAGAHAIAFDTSGARALVTSSETDAAVLVDMRSVTAIDTVAVDRDAVAVAYAPAARRFVIAHRDGQMTSVPEDSAEPTRRTEIAGNVELSAIVAAPRTGTVAALDRPGRRLVVVDARDMEVRAEVPLDGQPDELDVLGRFALIRDGRDPIVTWVDLADPSKAATLALGDAPAASIRVTSDGREALAAVADDRWVYRIHVMMGRPMVMEQTRNATGARWADVAAGGLVASGGGRYVQRTVFASPGRYRLTLRLPGSENASFTVRVAAPAAPSVVPGSSHLNVRTGQPVELRFRIRGADPTSASILAYGRARDGSLRQVRVAALRTGPGEYSATLTFPLPGRYRASLTSQEVKLPPGPSTQVSVSE